MNLLKKNKTEAPVKMPISQILILGMLSGASSIFGNAENGQLNTWINNIIRFEFNGEWHLWMVPLMSTISAVMGLIFLLVWGAISDKTRTKWGKRRPFLLGGIAGGLAMIFYIFSNNFWLCFFFDVVIIGIFMNMVLAANKALIPDLTVPEERGRVNSYIGVVSGVFTFAGIILFLAMDHMYSVLDPEGNEYLNLTGHVIILVFTGVIYILTCVFAFFTIKEPPPTSDENVDKKAMKWYEDVKNSFKFSELVKEKEFFKILIATLVFNMGTKMFMPWIFEFITALPINFTYIAIAIVEFVFLGFAISIIMGKVCDRYGRKKPLIFSISVGSIGFFLVPFAVETFNIILFMIVLALMLFVLTGVLTILNAWTQDLLPRNKEGQFIGINNLSSTVNQMIGVWIGGVIYGMFIDRTTAISWQMFFAGFVFLLSIPLFMKIKETLKSDLPVNKVKNLP
ncbi:MAG: MFS transporter [Promethearchaeota archaeon]